MGGIGESRMITARAQVKAIDLARREVTLVGPQGNVLVVHAGDAVRNLDKVKVGDTVVATYYASIALVLSAPGRSSGQSGDRCSRTCTEGFVASRCGRHEDCRDGHCGWCRS